MHVVEKLVINDVQSRHCSTTGLPSKQENAISKLVNVI
jgi:hypothetical protein